MESRYKTLIFGDVKRGYYYVVIKLHTDRIKFQVSYKKNFFEKFHKQSINQINKQTYKFE